MQFAQVIGNAQRLTVSALDEVPGGVSPMPPADPYDHPAGAPVPGLRSIPRHTPLQERVPFERGSGSPHNNGRRELTP
jgi:hypothetical protein